MNTKELQRIYNFMKENAKFVASIFATKDIPGPEPGVCLDGSKGIWRPFTDEEIGKIKEGNLEMLGKSINCVYIGDERSDEERMKDKTPGDGDYRHMNEEELGIFRKHISPCLAAIAYLNRDGLLKEVYFDDDGDSLDHYKWADRTLGIFGFGAVSTGHSLDPNRRFLTDVKEMPDISKFYERLASNVENRDPREGDLIILDELISLLWCERHIRNCISKDYKTLMSEKEYKDEYFSAKDLMNISGDIPENDVEEACNKLVTNGFLEKAQIVIENDLVVYKVKSPDRLVASV